MSSDCRIFWLKTALVLGFISSFLLSTKLWLSSRLYPLSPIVKFFPKISFPVDYIFFISLLVLLIFVLISRQPQKYIVSSVILIIILWLGDQSRWQTWIYQYTFMLIIVGFYPSTDIDVKKQNAVINTCCFIIASVYFWSGLQKLNIGFVNDIFPWFIKPVANLFSENARVYVNNLWIMVPLVEIFIGIGLLTIRCRNISIVLALAMHLFVLFLLGPLGRNTNNIVWPWNVTMAAFVIVLFLRNNDLTVKKVVCSNFFCSKLVFFLFGILPLFSFLDLWDSYLSSALYSGNVKEAIIYVDVFVKDHLPVEIRKYVRKSNNKYILDFLSWSYKEMNILPPPEDRLYKDIAKYLCKYAKDNSGVLLVIKEKPRFFNQRVDKAKNYNCLDL